MILLRKWGEFPILNQKIKGFIVYCQVANFKDKFIETLSIRLSDFNNFIKSNRFSNIRSVGYSHLSEFVAAYNYPSIRVKKSEKLAALTMPTVKIHGMSG